jgi:hypothetical protein
MIVGQGRSGTNWLLQLLDLSPWTHCRNEPNEISGSPMSKLPDAWIDRPAMPALHAGWDAAVDWTVRRLGERDQPVRSPKRHLYGISRGLQLHRLLERRRIRLTAGLLFPSLATGDWPLPRCLGNRARLGEALPILKLLQVPGWAVWVLRSRPRVLVIHIVRHPGGFLYSWRKRYLATRDRAEVALANAQRLRMVIDADPSWTLRFGDLEGMSADESELWYWRYATETIHYAGMRSSAYRLVIYENLAHHTDESVNTLYSACGLPLDPSIQARAHQTAEASPQIAHAWQNKVDTSTIALIDRVALEPDLMAWWQSAKSAE